MIGFNRFMKGNIMSDFDKVKFTWFTKPKQDRITVMSLGLGKSLTAPMNLSEGLT